MKKQVLLGLILMLLCFITGGVYIVISIQGETEKLEKVMSFHQVKFLRENLEHHIKAVQSDLLLQSSPHARDFATSISLIETMESAADSCLDCHHSEETSKQLDQLEKTVEHYMKLLSRALTIRAHNERLENARMLAFSHGESLLGEVTSLSVASADKISGRIAKIHNDISSANNILIACLVLGPIAIFIITVFFLKRFTGSISTLVTAAQTLEQGNLDYRVPDTLKDEFLILGNSFNGMAASLKDEQQKFQSVHQLYQTLFESAGDAIMITGLENGTLGQIISANKAASELYGYSVDELLGMNVVNLVPNGKEQIFRDRIRNVLSGEWSNQRVIRQKKDGTKISVSLSMGLLQLGEQKYLLTFCRDITEQLHAEEELQRANQMALVGQMAAGLAHEIKNPLAGVKVSLDVLSDELDLQPEDRELFARIINEINRMERLLKSLLNYARPPQPQFDLVDINRILDNSLKNVAVAASSKTNNSIHFEKKCATNLPQVEADSAQIQQVFLNILLNAVDALETEGTITAITRVEGKECIRIEISDTGKGMSAALQEKVFSPFFTTKSKGTGLGLSICKRLVEQHGGNIVVDSQIDSGTSFVITLPLEQKNRE
ncbi:MAG: ATP-binding protein [Spirochaetales bacterium]|jgi:two-component system sensor histidine kinase AtoS|nr:ATP-binding protein [Spirochaetales bacterium]